jgi:arylsulfatase A-like enzyme
LGQFADRPWPIQEKGFARMIEAIDQDVGNILALLRELEIDTNTLVMFSSDNGPHQEGGHRVDFFDSNGPLRGWKRDLYEGGIRVPLVAWWPGTIAAGAASKHISGFQDVFPTVLDAAGVQDIPETDGISMLPLLQGRPHDQQQHPHLFWEFYEQGGKVAVVKGHWKAVRRNTQKDPDAPVELYDLSQDPGEQHDLAEMHAERVAEMSRIMRAEHVDPE